MIARRSMLLGAALGLAGCSGMVAEPAVDRVKLLATLLELEKDSWQDVKDRNVDALRAFLTDDALLIFGDGTRYTKPEFLRAMPDLRILSLEFAPGAEVRVQSVDVATLIYRLTYTSAAANQKAITLRVVATSTYVRRAGKWMSALYQETPVR